MVPTGAATMSRALHSASNYHAWTYAWIAPFIRGRVLDVGSGTANHLTYLHDHDVVSIDLDEAAIADLQRRFEDRGGWKFMLGDITSQDIVDEFRPASFDTVLSCNVFEHIEHDELAFARSATLLRPGGHLVLILPAHQALYGSMDRLAGHFRRYDRAAARQRLERAGLTPAALRYVNLVGALGWFVNSRFVRHRDLSSDSINTQIALFDRLVIPILRRLEGRRAMPFGQSLLCVGRKP